MNEQIKVPVHKENVEFPNVFSRTSVINSQEYEYHSSQLFGSCPSLWDEVVTCYHSNVCQIWIKL